MNKPATKFSFENNIFDIIRYYAMLQVMINHMAEHFKLQLPAVLQALIKFQGVVILFALSGYLTAASLDRDSMNGNIDKPKFLKKRFFRIFPEYWLCVLINTVVIFVLYSPKPNLKEGLIYVIILLIWKWLKNKGIITWSILIACFAGLNYLTAIAGDGEMIAIKLLNCSIIPYLYMFMIGCFFYRFREKIFNCDNRLIAIAGLFFVAMYFVGDGLISGSYLPLLSGIALAAMTIIFGYLFKIKLRAKIDITYGTYLYHMVVVNAIIALGVEINYVVMGIGIVVSLLLGLMSSRFNRAIPYIIKRA